MANYESHQLDRAFAAISDPMRRAMLARLEMVGELSVSDLAGPLPIKLPTVLKHLNVLARAGLVERDKRGRTVNVRLTAAPLKAAADWLHRYERFWTSSLDLPDGGAETKETAAAAHDE